MGALLRTQFRRLAPALAGALLLLGPAVSALAVPTVLLISMDGTRPADLDATPLPALSRMQRDGARADRMQPVFPANTFPNHVSLVTGVSPEGHGIVNNVFVDSTRGRFSYAGDPTWLEAEPLWSIVASHGLRSASYYWVGSEGKWTSGRGPDHWRPFSSRTRASEKMDQILKWLALPEAERPQLITAWFHGADGAGHRHGPGADAVRKTLAQQDAQLARLFSALDVQKRWPETTVLVVSDHGMNTVEHSVDLQAALGAADVGARVHGGGGFVTVKLDDPDEDLDDALETARGLGLEAWARGQGPEGLEANHPRFGDFVVLAPLGTAISKAGLLGRLQASFMGGTHGYHPEAPSMGAIFLALGRGVAAGSNPGQVRALDVAPTVLSLLGLPVPDTMEGRAIDLAARAARPGASTQKGNPN